MRRKCDGFLPQSFFLKDGPIKSYLLWCFIILGRATGFSTNMTHQTVQGVWWGRGTSHILLLRVSFYRLLCLFALNYTWQKTKEVLGAVRNSKANSLCRLLHKVHCIVSSG